LSEVASASAEDSISGSDRARRWKAGVTESAAAAAAASSLLLLSLKAEAEAMTQAESPWSASRHSLGSDLQR
jgi:hypothetical protein